MRGGWRCRRDRDAYHRGSGTVTTQRFVVTDLDDVKLAEQPVSLIDGLLCSTGLAVVFGAPKSGKSFIISDALFHVAMGRTWACCRVLSSTLPEKASSSSVSSRDCPEGSRRRLRQQHKSPCRSRGKQFLHRPRLRRSQRACRVSARRRYPCIDALAGSSSPGRGISGIG